jgi:hypothetical protein
MPLAYLLDENLPRRLDRSIARHNARGLLPIQVVRVGDPPDLPLGSDDPSILLWAGRRQYILVSLDRSTLPTHLAAHLEVGLHSPGIFTIRPNATVSQLVEVLALAAHGSDLGDWRDRIHFVP